MRDQSHSTLAVPSSPPQTGQSVSIFVSFDHPLLRLKLALDWDQLRDVMVKHWRAAGKNVGSGPGQCWPVGLYVPLLVLMSVKALSSRQMEEYISENVVARLFLGLEDQLMPHIRDHSNIARAQAALGLLGWEEVNHLVVREAVRLGFGQAEILSSDTTVQEPQIGYPNEPGILRGVAQRCLRALRRIYDPTRHAVATANERAVELLKSVKEYHLFAKTKQQKQSLLKEMVWQGVELMVGVEQVLQQEGERKQKAKHSAMERLSQLVEVTRVLIPQIAQWVETGVVARGKLLHAGISEARAIVKNKAGKKVEFGLKWLVNRIKGGYVFGKVVHPHSDEKKMPFEGLKNYREVFGQKAKPDLIVYDRGGSCGPTATLLSKEGVKKIGIMPAGKATWLVAEEDRRQVKSQRGKTEGSIGTLKSKKYSFNHSRERSNEAVVAAGQRAMVCMNLGNLMRDIVEKEAQAVR